MLKKLYHRSKGKHHAAKEKNQPIAPEEGTLYRGGSHCCRPWCDWPYPTGDSNDTFSIARAVGLLVKFAAISHLAFAPSMVCALDPQLATRKSHSNAGKNHCRCFNGHKLVVALVDAKPDDLVAHPNCRIFQCGSFVSFFQAVQIEVNRGKAAVRIASHLFS